MRGMGTGFLTQGSNKRAITLNLKTEQGREILKKLVATADVLVENYRPGAFEALGLGYEDMRKINPKLIYASFSAFGQGGPRREQTAYDHVIQSTSGIMAMTGTPDGATRSRSARRRSIMQPGRWGLTRCRRRCSSGNAPGRAAHRHGDAGRRDDPDGLARHRLSAQRQSPEAVAATAAGHATSMAYQTKDGMVMLGASNLRQQKRLWTVLEHPEMVKRTNDERDADHEREEKLLSRDHADPQRRGVGGMAAGAPRPGSRVRTMGEALADPQIASRGVLHRHEAAPGVDGSFTVPVAAFKFAHDGPRVDRPPPMFGQHTDEVLAELGYSEADIAGVPAAKASGSGIPMQLGRLGVWYSTDKLGGPQQIKTFVRPSSVSATTRCGILNRAATNSVGRRLHAVPDDKVEARQLDRVDLRARRIHRPPGTAVAARALWRSLHPGPRRVAICRWWKASAATPTKSRCRRCAPISRASPRAKRFRNSGRSPSPRCGPLMLKLSASQPAVRFPTTPRRNTPREAARILGPNKWLVAEQKVTLETDPAKARALGRKELSRYMVLDNYRNNWLRIGFYRG